MIRDYTHRKMAGNNKMKIHLKHKFGRIAALALAVAALLMLLSGCNQGEKFQDATHELGTGGLTVEVFLKDGIKPGKAFFVTDMKRLDLTVPGTHKVTLRYGSEEETVNLTIQDTIAPQVTFVSERILRSGEELRPEDFVEVAPGREEMTISFVQEPTIPEDYSDITVEVMVCDANGNEVRGSSKVSFQWMHHELIWEYGPEITKGDILVNVKVDGDKLDQADLDRINESGVGSYTLDIQGETCAITVQDTKGPELDVQLVHVWPSEYVDINRFVLGAEDPSGVAEVKLLTEVNTGTKGEYPVQIRAVDTLGNETIAETVLKVNSDHRPPVIAGMEDLVAKKNEKPDYETGVSAMDMEDGTLDFVYDDSEVDLTTAGTYFATYTAQDSSGNEITVRRKILVPPDEGDVQALVEEIAAQIGDDPKEIRNFAWQKIRYSASWGEPDPTWHGFTNWSGNCYVHAFCLKALLDAKGYETQLIWTTDKSHYWVLVNLEEMGMGWRHMDATPSEQHVRILYMTDWDRYANLDGRNWDREAWPKAE